MYVKLSDLNSKFRIVDMFVIFGLQQYFVLGLSPRHGASSGCGWRRRPPDTEGSCDYIEQGVADNRQGVDPRLWGYTRG